MSAPISEAGRSQTGVMPLRADRFSLGNYLGVPARNSGPRRFAFPPSARALHFFACQAAIVAIHLRRRFSTGPGRVDHPAIQDLCIVRGVHHAWPLRHDPAFQRHAVVSLHGLRPRDGQYANAPGEPLSRAGSCWFPSCSPAWTCAIAQVYAFLAIAWFWGVKAPPLGYLMVLPALFLGGLMLGALGLLLSSMIKQLENFAGVMNFVIFPDVFRLPCPLSALANPGGKPPALQDLPCQPLFLCCRTGSLRVLRSGGMDLAGRSDRMHRALSRRCNHRLRSLTRLDEPEAGHGR